MKTKHRLLPAVSLSAWNGRSGKIRSLKKLPGLPVVSLVLGAALQPLWAATPALWLAASDGNWSDSFNWSTDPFSPYNGTGAEDAASAYDVSIDATGAAYTVSLGPDAIISSLALNSADATLLGNGTIEVLGTATLTQGSYLLDSGKIQGGTWDISSGARLSVGDFSFGELAGATVNGDLHVAGMYSTILISGGTTFTTAHLSGEDSVLSFDAGSTLAGTILFEGAAGGPRGVELAGMDGSFTIGSTGVIRTAADLGNSIPDPDFGLMVPNSIGPGYGGWAMALVNEGLISSETSGQLIRVDADSFSNSSGGIAQAKSGGLLDLGPGSLVNSGTIQALDSGIVNLFTSNWANSGTLQATTGGVLNINADTWANHGPLNALTGGTLNIFATDWTNSGTFTVDATSTLNLGGNLDATAGGGSFSNATGGAINVLGFIDNTGNTLALDGSWTVNGGYIQGGTLNIASGKTLLFASNPDNMLDGVEVNGSLTLSDDGALARIDGGTTFTTAHLSGGGSILGFADGQTISGTVLFEGPAEGPRSIEIGGGDGTLTIATTGRILTAADLKNTNLSPGPAPDAEPGDPLPDPYQYPNTIGFFGYDMTLINHGLISSQTQDQLILSNPVSLTNSATGTLQAINGGTAYFAADDILNEGLVQATDGGTLILASLGLIHTGTFQALRGGTLGIGADEDWVNGGRIFLDATSNLVLGGTFDITAGLGDFDNSAGGSVLVSGTLLNDGHNLTLNALTGSWTLENGAIHGGSLSFADGKSLLVEKETYNLIDGVTVNGDLTLTAEDAVLSLGEGTTFQTAHLGGKNSSMLFTPDQILSGSILFEGATPGERGVGLDGIDGEHGNFTIGAGGVIRTSPDLANGYTNRIGNSFDSLGLMDLTNEGLISSRTAGQLISLEPSTLVNHGIIEALDGGTLRLGTALSNYNAATGTLTGGTWKVIANGLVTTLELNQAGGIVINNASILLSGTNAVFDDVLPMEENQGSFHLANGRNFTTVGDLLNSGAILLTDSATSLNLTGAFTNTSSGTVSLFGGTLAGADITNSGTISGYGRVTGQPLNHGTIQAAGGTLLFENGILGGSGTVQIDPGATLDLSGGVNDSNADFLIHNGSTPGSLNLGANNFRVDVDYTNASAGSGNSYDPRANVSGTGKILAGGDATQSLTGDVSGGSTASPVLDFGNVHLGGSSTLSYQIANAGATGPSLRGALRTASGNGNITDPRLSGAGVTAGDYGPLGTGTDSGNLDVTFTPDTAGALSGQTVGIVSNFENIPGQTLGITGAAYRYAAPQVTSATTIGFGIVHVGDSVSQSVVVKNNAAADGYSEGLNGSFSGSDAGISASGSFSQLAPGDSSGSALTVGLNTTAAGTVNGTATVSFESDGSGNSGLGVTALPAAAQDIAITGQVNNYAKPRFVQFSGQGTLTQTDANTFTLDFGTVNNSSVEGAPLMTLRLLNDVSGPSDTLAGSFLKTGSSFTTSHFDAFDGVGSGQSLDGLTVSLDNSQNGSFSGSITLSGASQNTGGYNGGLGNYVLNLTGTVVPEPSGAALLLLPLLAGAGMIRRRRTVTLRN